MLYSSLYPTNHLLTSLSIHEHRVPLCHADAVHALMEEKPFLQQSLPPIFMALQALEECPLLRTVLDTFPPHINYAVKASLLAPDVHQERRLSILEKLIRKRDDVSNVVEAAGPVPLPFLLRHECVFGIIEGMLLDPAEYRRELAFLFTQLSIYWLPPRLRKVSSAMLPLKVLPTYSNWFLCSAAERRLKLSMDDQAVLLVNDALLLKFNGKMSGLALHTTLLADGTQLMEGCWYAPIDQREAIRDAFDRGESRLSLEGQWTFIRVLKDSSLLQEARVCAAALPTTLPLQIDDRSREKYRRYYHEGFV
ncbi:hypothetical protein KSF_106870 [Reticulibacter mediterranei]|uniref:Uncharacterized protein n=1 Tax=Reticulibacter mediterranei TaxID=2778369 RepID=A0A8J3IZ67_9CHLR|nr:hypothetical protein [Reticulibacter mediterranei]GHP00640.1 hypothetical protein KSF_106870 [Reticulibacter mediterranei]